MPERVLDSSDDQRTLVLVVALRVLRDPVLGLDATREALAERGEHADDVAVLVCFEQVVATARRDGRIPSVARRRRRTALDVLRVDPAMRAELHALAASRLARGDEPLALAEEVICTVARLEREAPTVQQLRALATSGLVVGLETEVGDRDGH